MADMNENTWNENKKEDTTFLTCMIIRKLIITRSLSFNIVVQYNSDTMDF